MTSRVLTALLVLVLSAAPALGALCGMDCVAAGAALEHSDGSHAPGEHHAPTPELPHDCHHAGVAGDLDVMGPGPQSCTHLQFEAAPAKPTPGNSAPVLRDVLMADILAVTSFGHRLDRLARPGAEPAHSPVAPILVLPLRI